MSMPLGNARYSARSGPGAHTDLLCAAGILKRFLLQLDHIGGYLRIAADQRWLQTVIRFRAGHRAKRRLGAGRDCAEGGADGTQIVLFGVPGDCGSGVPGSACTGPATGALRLGPSCIQRTTLAFLSRRLGTPRTVAYRV